MSSDSNLPLLDDSGKQPFKRRLYPENCRKANSHFSAIAAGCRSLSIRQRWRGTLTCNRYGTRMLAFRSGGMLDSLRCLCYASRYGSHFMTCDVTAHYQNATMDLNHAPAGQVGTAPDPRSVGDEADLVAAVSHRHPYQEGLMDSTQRAHFGSASGP